MLDKLGKAKVLSKVDLQQGFYQIRVKPSDVHKCAFNTPFGHFELLVMPMGQANSTATMQRTMSAFFPESDFGSFVLNMLDDILVYSESEEEHLVHLEKIFMRLKEEKFYLKRSKCLFGVSKLVWRGHQIGEGKRSIDPEKSGAIQSFLRPRNAQELHSFLGLIQYCREYLPNLSLLTAPLSDLLKKGVKFEWTEEHQKAFENIKKLVIEAVELNIPIPGKAYVLETDASNVGLGALLFQEFGEDGLKLVACNSRKLNEHERNYPTHEKELLAIVWALKTWRHYVEGTHVEVRTDHASLPFIQTQQQLSRRMLRWIEELQQYDITV
jgi:hypothetical protein